MPPYSPVGDPGYEEAIGGVQQALTQRPQGARAGPDEQDELYDSLKEMLLQQSLAEAAPKKKEPQGFDARFLIPGYYKGYILKQQLEQRNEAIKLEQQAQKGQQAARTLQMQRLLGEIKERREQRQQRQQVGDALRLLREGGLDPQATAELEGQVQQGLLGMGETKQALDYGQPATPREVNTPFEAILAAEQQQGGPDVYERAIRRYGEYQQGQQKPPAPTEAGMALDAAGGDSKQALEILKAQRGGSGSLEETRTLQREKLQLDIEAKRREMGGQLPAVDKKKFALYIRRSILQEPSFKDFQSVRSGYQGVVIGAKRGDGAGDLAMINGLQRIVDPGVSVREGEFKTVAQAQGFLQRLFNTSDRLFEGDLLSPRYREAVVALATALAQEKIGTAREELSTVYGDSAQAAGVDLDRLLPLALDAPAAGQAAPAPGQGKTITRAEIMQDLMTPYPDGPAKGFTPAQAGHSVETMRQWYESQGYRITD